MSWETVGYGASVATVSELLVEPDAIGGSSILVKFTGLVNLHLSDSTDGSVHGLPMETEEGSSVTEHRIATREKPVPVIE